jgi:hypothetical protein
MNDEMQVSGAFFPAANNHLQAFRWTPPDTLDSIAIPDALAVSAADINGSGCVCGSAGYCLDRNGNITEQYPYRYDFENQPEVFFNLQDGGAAAINTDADLFCRVSAGKVQFKHSIYVYQNDLAQFYSVDSLIDPDDPNATTWSRKSDAYADDMTDRDPVTGFGVLVGSIGFSHGSRQCYLLTPK